MTASVDLFCRVIDNLGDIGVSWRLARQLAGEKGCTVRLWVDDLSSLRKLEPDIDLSLALQTVRSVCVHAWDPAVLSFDIDSPADMVIAAFSCDLPDAYLRRMVERRSLHPTRWIQLEYLSAEPWVEDFHQRSSLRSDGLSPIFFFPGFTPQTGGLIREDDIGSVTPPPDRQWLSSLGLSDDDIATPRIVSVFTYPGAPLLEWARQLEQLETSTLVLIPQGVRTQLDSAHSPQFSRVRWKSIPFLRQPDYDRLLRSMDFNIVRGEDSFVRAIWAGKPFVWHIYPQEQRVHHEKLQAWLNRAGLPAGVHQLMHQWSDGLAPAAWNDWLSGLSWGVWQQTCLQHRQQLFEQEDLATQLLRLMHPDP